MGGRHQLTAQSQENVYGITSLTMSRFIFMSSFTVIGIVPWYRLVALSLNFEDH
jgi:hypothetical protein